MKKMVISVAILCLSFAVQASEYKAPTPEELDAHLALNSSAMACEALGQASKMIASIGYESGMKTPDKAVYLSTMLKGFLEKDKPTNLDMGEAAYIATLQYALDTPVLVEIALSAAVGAKSQVEARIKAHQATASYCVASQNLKHSNGYYETYKLREEVVNHYKAHQ